MERRSPVPEGLSLSGRRVVPVLVGLLSLAQPLEARGDARNDLQHSLGELGRIQGDIRERTLPILVLLRRLEGTEMPVRRAKIIRDTAPIRETDNAESRTLLSARRNDEMPVLEQKDRWVRLRLADGREGWVTDGAVQILTAPSPRAAGETLSESERSEVLGLAADLLQEVNARADSAEAIYAGAQETLRALPEPEKRQLAGLQADLARARAKITGSRVYAKHFYEKYAALAPPRQAGAGAPRGIDGSVAFTTGRTSYEAQTEASQLSRDLDFDGGMRLGNRGRLTASLMHHNEVLQTPYGSTDLRLGHVYRIADDSQYASYFAATSYDDRSTARNSFKRLGAGVANRRPVGKTSSLSSALDLDSKSYDEAGTNEYRNAQLVLGLQRRSAPGKQLDLGIRALVQSSDVGFLAFQRFLPQMTYRHGSERGTFTLRSELEWIGFKADARNNDFAREEVALGWARAARQHSASATAKQFPHNTEQSYLKLAGATGWRGPGPLGGSRTDLSLLFVYFPSGGNRQSHYFDLRADRSGGSKLLQSLGLGPMSYDLGLFGRVWADPDPSVRRDHVLDAQARCSWAVSRVQVGPVAGAHLALAKGANAIRRDGNDIRLGLEANGTFVARTSPIHVGLRYEMDFVYGNVIAVDPATGVTTVGNLVTRHPTTTQFSAGASVPIRRDLDLKIDLNRYSVDPDVDPKTSIDPVASRSRLALTAGLGYRFAL